MARLSYPEKLGWISMGKGVKMVPKGPMEEYCEIRKLSISGDSRLFYLNENSSDTLF